MVETPTGLATAYYYFVLCSQANDLDNTRKVTAVKRDSAILKDMQYVIMAILGFILLAIINSYFGGNPLG